MTEYFSHDYDTRNDEKVMDLMSELGWEGYGIFWGIVELLYQNDGVMQSQYKRIAFALNTNESIIKDVVEKFGLFIINGDEFWSESIIDRLKERNDKSQKARDSANSRWKKANAKRTQSDSNAIKERKGKETKESKSNTLMSELSSSDDLSEYENIALSFWELTKATLEELNINSTDLSKSKIINWVDPVRLAIEKDLRTTDEFREIFKFLDKEIPQKNGFSWKSNIRSGSSLRVKFEKLLVASRSGNLHDKGMESLKDEIKSTLQA